MGECVTEYICRAKCSFCHCSPSHPLNGSGAPVTYGLIPLLTSTKGFRVPPVLPKCKFTERYRNRVSTPGFRVCRRRCAHLFKAEPNLRGGDGVLHHSCVWSLGVRIPLPREEYRPSQGPTHASQRDEYESTLRAVVTRPLSPTPISDPSSPE